MNWMASPDKRESLHFHEPAAIGGVTPEGKFDRGLAGPDPAENLFIEIDGFLSLNKTPDGLIED